MKYLSGFGAFWWEFFISDTPEIFIGCLVILALTYVVRESAVGGAVALPVAVVALLAISAWRGKKQ